MVTANPPKIKPRRPDSTRSVSIAGRLLAALGALALLSACALCARWGIADVIAQDAIARQSALQTFAQKAREPADAVKANAIRDALLAAQQLEPGNPTLAEQLGELHALVVRGEGAAGAAGAQYAKALAQYSKAVVLRPTSPYSWANLAWIKYQLGQADPLFYRALENAVRLGPWEPEVQFTVTDLGFAMWDEMPQPLRLQILDVAKNSQRRYADKLVAIASRRGRLAQVCGFEKLVKLPACVVQSTVADPTPLLSNAAAPAQAHAQ